MPVSKTTYPTPLQSTGSLNKYTTVDLTPSIGTEFDSSVKLKDLLNAEANPNAIRDLAILISERGVVFFREQDDLTISEQLELVDRLGRETGKPKESGLHIHPIQDIRNELGDSTGAQKANAQDEVLTISSELRGTFKQRLGDLSTRASKGWHSDISFEPYPSDYAILRLNTLPSVGGDTLWASGYQAYDRLSKTYQDFLSTLTATHEGTTFKSLGIKFREPRGHPENIGQELTAVHPVIRTNPVTGWKSIYVNNTFTRRINELNKDESDNLLDYLREHISQNHDLQVRFRWQKGSIAIWDNRSTFHSATQDYGEQVRIGERATSLGERPYYDSLSASRSEVLEQRQPQQAQNAA